MHQAAKKHAPATRPDVDTMNLRVLRTVSLIAFGSLLAAWPTLVLSQVNEPESPYGGSVVEDIIARVNDEIITKSDYDRAESELDQEGQQNHATMQEMSAQRKDLLRNLIDQQLWLAKGKELDITGETELVKKLDEIRKQYNLESIDDLEKAAKDQGVSFEDFKAGIRNQIITQEVMRQEVGEHIQMTPGEVERYYEQHKKDYTQPESERLSEILISTGTDGSSDPAKVAAAKAKADDLEARLHAGGDFAQLARSFSDGSTAASGGDLGEYKRGQLPKVLEDKTFDLQSGQYTDPILTRQGYIILKIVQHNIGGPRPFKDVEEDVDQAYYMSLMQPSIQDYLSKMRNEAAIWIRPGYVDTAATYAELHPSISFSVYTPPAPKKKAKVERTRFRESTRTFRDKSGPAAPPADSASQAQAPTPPATPAATKKKKSSKKEEANTEKPGKKEKIRFGQAPRETLPSAAANSETENAGALPETPSNPETASNTDQPANPLEPTAPTQKTRFSSRARQAKTPKPPANGGEAGATGPLPPSAAEVADQQTQSTPLGPSDSSAKKKKKTSTATGDKTRLANKKKSADESQPKPAPQPTPITPVAGAPAPADHPPAPQPQQQNQQ
jgi:peptidyl-prolyl cis-trans isomerase SurA